MVWLTLGLRAIVNVEALNMAEAIGNFTRHRKAGIIVRTQSGYLVRFVPVVSGESMAHAYQSWLVRLAPAKKQPVCYFCKREEFVKHAQPQLFGQDKWEQDLSRLLKGTYEPKDVEKAIVSNCVVEDIGGFLLAARVPVKRTSRFTCGYMVPAIDVIDKVVIEPQLHVRHTPTTGGQMIYYVEVGSAIYTWSFGLDLSSIGVSSYTADPILDKDVRKSRAELAIDALAEMLETKIFGAKLSRFSPVVDYESILVVVSRNMPFTVSAPVKPEYIEDTLKRTKKLNELFNYEFKVISYIGTCCKDIRDRVQSLGIEVVDTVVEAFAKAKEVALKWLLQEAEKS